MRVTVTTLGTGTVAPQADRAAAAHWVETGSVRLLLDCGAGTLQRAAAFAVPWHTVTHLALTHFHVDHWGELPHYLFALRWGIEPPRSQPLTVLGPRGMRTRLTLLAGAYGDWVMQPEFPLEIVELDPGRRHTLAPAVYLDTLKTPHTDESLAYAVTAGESRVVYTGDTGYSEELAAWAADCDLLLAECSLPEERAVSLHLTPSQAGTLARVAGARRLVLTHFYPVYAGADPAAMAAEAFGGDVVAARDGDRFTIGD
ncbi:MAG: MBL fold metallo-hydrolase [Gemmatimonadota bacterium]|nr:MBL fold metallo-hydrolase [Gemmatimonadota bacterium]